MSLRLPVEHAHHSSRTGSIVREFRGSALAIAKLVVLELLSVAMLIGATVAVLVQRKYTLLFVSALLLVAVGFLGQRLWWTLRARVFVGEQGLCIVRGAAAQSLAWRDVQRVDVMLQRRAKGLFGLGGEENVVVGLQVHGPDAGAPIDIPDTLGEYGALVGLLRDRGVIDAAAQR